MIHAIQEKTSDLVNVLVDPAKRIKANRFVKNFNGSLQNTWTKLDFKIILNNEVQTLTHLIHIQERLMSGYSNITKDWNKKI